MSEKQEKKNNRAVRILLIVIAIIMIIVGSVWFGVYLFGQFGGAKPEPTTVSQVEEISAAENKVNNPVDFASIQNKNKEIYAWLKVPGTKVDYPVCQSTQADDFYLKHDAYSREWLASGAIYTQSLNTTTFRDRVTVIYGHNGYSDTMFTTLHKFEKQEFFDEHDKFYIYTPNSRLTYQIVSAFKFDDRHIMNSYDFQNDEIFSDFLSMIQNPESSNKKVRTPLDKELTNNDNIVVLSTCITNQPSSRYLICGVLTKDEATN